MQEENNYNQPEQQTNQPEEHPAYGSVPAPSPVHRSEGLLQTSDTLMEDRVFAALSYVSVLFIVPLILKSDNEDIRFHARQGMALFGAEMVVWFALFLLDTFLTALFPSGELFVVRTLGALAWVAFMGVSIAGVYMAVKGKRWPIPLIGRIAQRIRI